MAQHGADASVLPSGREWLADFASTEHEGVDSTAPVAEVQV